MKALSALIRVTFVTAATAAGVAHAQVTEIYKCIDPQNGRPLYTSDKRETQGRKCELVSREVNVVPAQKLPQSGPSSFPRESAQAKASASARQREILEKELATEQQALAEQESIRMGDEKNYARVLDRLQPYKDNVDLHQKNIEALKRELGNIR